MVKMLKKNVLLVAHRGASFYEPENTLRAVKRAIELGADMVEVDVRLSKDGFVVVIHDETVDRTTDGTGYVEKKSLKELKNLDAGLGEKIPTLDEVIETVKGKVKLVIELKKQGFEDKVIEILRQKDFVEDAILTSFFHKAVKKVKELNSRIKTGIIFRCSPVDVTDLALKSKADILFPEYKYVNSEMVDEIHRKGLEVYVWTIDNLEEAKAFVKMGVNGIVTNKPDLFQLRPKPKKVFLSGPIQGMERKQFYRKRLGGMLKSLGFEVLDPWEREKIFYSYRGKEWWKRVPVRGFIKRDLEDIDKCDFLVAYIPKVSAGTCMELFYAKNKGKPTYVICKLKNPSPWIVAHSTKIFRTSKVLKRFLEKNRF
jgi:glycerophosphoryl diester phosphodiesterase